MKVTDKEIPLTFGFLERTLGLFHLCVATNTLKWNAMNYLLHDIGKTSEPLTFLGLQKCIHPADWERYKSLLERVEAGVIYETYYRVVRKDKRIVYIHSRYECMRNELGEEYFVGSCSDVTELRSVLEGLELQRRDDLSKLLRSVSHEIRNPLQGILSSAQALMNLFDANGSGESSVPCVVEGSPANSNPSPPESAISILEDLIECATHQNLVVNDLLDYAVVLHAVKQPKMERVDVDAEVQSVANMFRNSAKNKGIGLTYKMPEVHRVVKTDRSSVKRILMNIVSNAMKFTTVGSVNISVTYEESTKELIVEVVDTGAGIPESFKGQLFTTIGLTTTNSEYINGSGLGLSICKTLADSIDGCIMFRDNEPQGTIMRLCVVCDRCALDPQISLKGCGAGTTSTEKAVENTPGDAKHPLRTCRVLVAEDNIINTKVLTRMLQTKVGELKLTPDGAAAVEAFENGTFDVVLLDYHMPVMGGREAAFRIRSQNSNVPIIFLTGEIGDALQGLEAQFSPCTVLLKPCSAKELLHAVTVLISHPVSAKSSSKRASVEHAKITKSCSTGTFLDNNMVENKEVVNLPKISSFSRLPERIPERARECSPLRNSCSPTAAGRFTGWHTSRSTGSPTSSQNVPKNVPHELPRCGSPVMTSDVPARVTVPCSLATSHPLLQYGNTSDSEATDCDVSLTPSPSDVSQHVHVHNTSMDTTL